jgi:uncharacterized membrane protein YqjE
MAGDTMRFRNPAGHAGLFHNLFALLNSLAGFVESRLGLVAQESKTALVHLMVLVGCIVAAGILGLLGYVFVIASAIAGLSYGLKISWIWISLAAAGVHFVLAWICVLIALSRMKKSMFEVTAAELKKDREWLRNLDAQNLSNN